MKAKINSDGGDMTPLFSEGLSEKFNSRAFRADSHEMTEQEAYNRLTDKMTRLMSQVM